ncbi:unnamed protein product [Cylicocyclus nassatus]|uniref:Uncharacterized protein n=1 Tax=Cylicocyclus nassatus TaxID=53992 RepID=A0AA36GPN7_CYLNA|nr:unnamed protein product [Cylicocyclus nassatus]
MWHYSNVFASLIAKEACALASESPWVHPMKNARKNSTICWCKKLSTAAKSGPVSQKHSRVRYYRLNQGKLLCLQRNTRLRRSDLVERTRQV